MSIRKRRGGQWFYRKWVKTPNGGRVRVFGTPREYGLSNTKAACEEAMRRKIAEIIDGKRRTSTAAVLVPTLRSFVPTYLEHSQAKNKGSTYGTKQTLLDRHILPEVGDVHLNEVTYAAIEDLKHALMKPRKILYRGKWIDVIALGHKSINNVLSVLRRLLVVAMKRGLIVSVPDVEWLAEPQPDFDFLDFKEADAMLAAAACDQEWRIMIMVGLRCGLRQGELLVLKWEDIDLKLGLLRVRRAVYRGAIGLPKGGRGRDIELGEDVLAALKEHRHLRSEWVFCDMDGERFTPGACKHPLYRIASRAKLRRVGWHVLRHTFASHLAMRGATPIQIQQLLGHSELSQTMRYMHLSPAVRRDAVRLLDGGAQMVPKNRDKTENGRTPRISSRRGTAK